MPDLLTLLGIVILAVCSYAVTGWYIKYARKKNITDIPTDRSSHSIPTPRGGGLGFVILSIVAFSIYFYWQGLLNSLGYVVFIITLSSIAILGWFDDTKDLSQLVRFVAQVFLASLILLFIGGLDTFYLPFLNELPLGILGPILGLLWLTGVTNIYNFMDGVDGIATIQALSASAGWMIFALLWNEPVLLTVNLILFTTVLVFLRFNWEPAMIFMGDVGSVFLGFFFAVMPFFAASLSDQISISITIWLGGIMLWPFLFDSSSTLLCRLKNGENIFKAHRSHLYQRLNIAGWSHSKISTLYLSFSFFCIILTIIYFYENDIIRAAIIILLVLASIFYLKFVHQVEKLRNDKV